MKRMGIGLSKTISMGNTSNISFSEALEYLNEDKDTKVILLYIEGISNGREFLKTARKISKPIVVWFVGSSEAGSRAAASHTGSIGGSKKIYSGIFKQANILEVESLRQLLNVGNLLEKNYTMSGKDVGIITSQGGVAVSTSHLCEQHGLNVPPFPKNVQEELSRILPITGSGKNPVDATFTGDFSCYWEDLPKIVLNKTDIDALIISSILGSDIFTFLQEQTHDNIDIRAEAIREHTRDCLEEFVSIVKNANIPVVVIELLRSESTERKILRKNNVPVFDDSKQAVEALSYLQKLSKYEK